MQNKAKIEVRTMVLIGVLSALVFVLSMMQVPVPIPGSDNGRIHLGNVMCILAGVLFGPLVGGLSSGIGSMMFDFMNPAYTREFWITFITKFAMGALAGLLANKVLKKIPLAFRYGLSAAGASACYLMLYLVKTAIMQRVELNTPWEGVWIIVGAKAAVSGVNAIFAVVACTILAPIFAKALQASGLFKTKQAMHSS